MNRRSRIPFARLAGLALLALALSACSQRSGPKPDPATVGARTPSSLKGETLRGIRTTAYTHTEPGGSRNAIGGRLSYGAVRSAASDWSHFPLGTRFRVIQTGELRVIDDYGSALVGTRTIDLYKPSRKSMRAWGVRHIDIQILEWGSPRRSLEVLVPRQRNGHVRRMVAALRAQSQGVPSEFRLKKS